MRKDMLRKYLCYNEQVRVVIVDATNMISELRDLHNMSNVATAAVGRTLIVSTMMASMLKNSSDRITVQIKGNGPIGNIVVCGDKSLKMKAYASNPQVDLPKKENGKLNVSKVVGQGYLNVVKDIGLKDPYIGVCELVSSEIAEDFAYYFANSEQIPSAVFLGVNFSKENNVQKASGYIIEPLPEASDEIISTLEKINSNIDSVTNLMIDLENIDDVVKTITGDNNVVCVQEEYPILKCDCNKERIYKTIIALGRKEVDRILDDNNDKMEICCHFCNKKYNLYRDEIKKLFN